MAEPRLDLATLPQASVRLGYVKKYFSLRRHVWRDHGELPFPLPAMHVNGADVYDVVELAKWNERRLKRPKPTRGSATNDSED